MRKAVLEGNILPKAKQRFVIDGLPEGEIMWLTRDVINVALGVIDLPDQTKVPGGRRRAGEFTATLQFAQNQDREAMLDWFSESVDAGTDDGISPHYKKNGTIIYHRLFRGNPGLGANSGTDLPPVRAVIFGVWCSQYNLPDFDMNSDEGDGDCVMECTFQFDDAEIDRKNAIERVLNRNKGGSVGTINPFGR